MKYKVGDKVRMKKFECDFGADAFYSKHNYVLTIKDYDGVVYRMEEDNFFCYLGSSIEGLYVEKFFELETITRFELMEL